ncbi:MAG: hypothetical protein ERJ68_06640 [Aphanocapsa feldmannii 277cI]|uniref:Hydantoinase A/oxoprolinase domain-containing protein n=1 Tax=Aphanocapsa feldmannii 277cI TaxID=2507554 RepID=A0A524RSQ6_9CHRO|nr:MAG: hypothetical protein ERJ68_06640 [Aphanocapsa feldmannii 277cI]
MNRWRRRFAPSPSPGVLVAFGGAGGQHACEVAELLGISEIHLHPCAGVLSAWGIGQARLLTLVEKSTDLKLLDFCLPAQQQAFTALEALARERLGDADLSLLLSVERRLWCHHGRGEAEFSLHPAAPEAMVRQVQALHHERFGYRLEGVETLRVCRLQPPRLPMLPLQTLQWQSRGCWKARP